MLDRNEIMTLLKWNIVKYIKALERKSISAIEHEVAIKTYLIVLKMQNLIDEYIHIGINEANQLLRDLENV